MEKYYYCELKLLEEHELDIDTIALEAFRCTGIEEFSIDEPTVDEILGERSYSGGDLPLEVINEVEERLRDNEARKKYYFNERAQALSFSKEISEKFSVPVQFIEKDSEDWNEKWRETFHKIEVAQNLRVVPSWEKEGTASSDADIYIYPGMGFGTGGHETTYLCLKIFSELDLESYRKKECLDFGCGSGILGIAAQHLNDMTVDYYDIDQEALVNCKQNLELNNIELGHKLLLPNERSVIDKKYDLIFANILQNILLEEADFLCGGLRNNGKLIVSGLLRSQDQIIEKTYLDKNEKLKHIRTITKGDWVAMEFIQL